MRLFLIGTLAGLVGAAGVGCGSTLGTQDQGGGSGADASDSGGPPDAGSRDVYVEGVAPGHDSGADGSDGSSGCAAGALRCSGNTPQQCIGGAWQDQAVCGGSTPVCSNGVCGSFRTTGGIRSTAPASAGADAGVRLVSGGFETGTRSCDFAGVCVTGGIVP